MLSRPQVNVRVPLARMPPSQRRVSSAVHFYANRQLELYAAKEANRLTLRQLVCIMTLHG